LGQLYIFLVTSCKKNSLKKNFIWKNEKRTIKDSQSFCRVISFGFYLHTCTNGSYLYIKQNHKFFNAWVYASGEYHVLCMRTSDFESTRQQQNIKRFKQFKEHWHVLLLNRRKCRTALRQKNMCKRLRETCTTSSLMGRKTCARKQEKHVPRAPHLHHTSYWHFYTSLIFVTHSWWQVTSHILFDIFILP
jgi:hypothetical protein